MAFYERKKKGPFSLSLGKELRSLGFISAIKEQGNIVPHRNMSSSFGVK